MSNRQRIETALANGELWLAMHGGKWWRARRNGATKLWKTRPADFEIPVKAGLRSCARIDSSWIEGEHYRIGEKP